MQTKDIAQYIDHTLLKPEVTRRQIIKLCEEAQEYGFASVCVNPCNINTAYQQLKGSGVKICTVIGFPLGATITAVKAFETREAIAAGAEEIDMVINIGALKDRNEVYVHNDIEAVVKAAQGKIVKVIIETGLLTDDEKVLACQLAMRAGAHFVKTSTGFNAKGATEEDVRLIRDVVGSEIGVKASGGVRSLNELLAMLEAGATRIGTSSGVAIINGNGIEAAY
ncbi:MAG: deoxyribose-phosphate aldolase [Bacillota bacterium]